MRVLLGNNAIDNCDAAVVVNGIEVFRLRERAADERLVCDFDVRDKAGRLLAQVAKNSVVMAAQGYKVENSARESSVIGPSGRVIARVEEVERNTVKITGEFWIGSYHVVITDQALTLGGCTLSGRTFSACGKAIILGPGSATVGNVWGRPEREVLWEESRT